MKKFGLQGYEKDDLISAEKEIKDLLELYLDSDLAGDNNDRRQKLQSVKIVSTMLSHAIS